jgi:hypothetical protein
MIKKINMSRFKRSVCLITLVLFLCSSTALRSQTVEKKSILNDLQFLYSYSMYDIASGKTAHVPFSVGFSISFNVCKRINTEIGVTLKTENEKHETIVFHSPPFVPDPDWPHGEYYHSYKCSYIDIPWTMNVLLIKHNSIKLFANAGARGSLFYFYDYWNPYTDGNVHNQYRTDFRFAFQFGMTEYFDLNENIGVFLSQSFVDYFKRDLTIYKYSDQRRGDYNPTIDLKIGLSYKFKKTNHTQNG